MVAHTPEAIKASVPSAKAPAADPTYVDFEKMRAPFDLPVLESWVDSEDAQGEPALDAEAPEGTPPVRQLARTGRTATPDHHALVHVSLEDIEPAALTLDAGSLWSLLCPATLSCRSLADIGLTAA